MTLERDLQRALGRKAPPPDFADRVVARLQHDRRTPRRPIARAAGAWLAAAAVVVLAAGSARYYAEQQARVEAERARDDVFRALQITNEALATVQRRVEASLADTR